MKNKVIKIPPMKSLIKRSPGFEKKELSTYKLDILGLCGFGCRYCSSNAGNYLRINREKFAGLTKKQMGSAVLPNDDPSLTFIWPDVVIQLRDELKGRKISFGKDHTLVFSMLTDGFSPYLVEEGITKEILELLLKKTSFRIRILTKNAVVGEKQWVDFFDQYRNRFVVGLSIGSLDDQWSKKIELGTSLPSERLQAMNALQSAGVPTFGMLCPVFPDVLNGNSLEQLIDGITPNQVEHIWAEPYNDRINWQKVRKGYRTNSKESAWLTDVYENHMWDKWSKHATGLYTRLLTKAKKEGWTDKLRYLLYEDRITKSDAVKFQGMVGMLPQSKPGSDGKSKNKYIAQYQ